MIAYSPMEYLCIFSLKHLQTYVKVSPEFLKDNPKIFFKWWLLFVLLCVKMIPHDINNPES